MARTTGSGALTFNMPFTLAPLTEIASENFGDDVSPSRHCVSMDLGDRIKEARKRKGWSQQRLATDAGVTRPAVSQWEAGDAIPTRENLSAVAGLLGVSERWLLDGVDAGEGGLMPVKGEVAAGIWREALDVDLAPIPVAPNPSYPAAAQYALLVRGDSMNRFALDSEYLVVVDVGIAGITPMLGDIVVVQKRHHGITEATAKRLTINDGNYVLIAESDNPRYEGQMSLDPTDDETEIVISAIVIGKYTAISRGQR